MYRCVCCGERMVKPYTLRIDRLGGKSCADTSVAPSVKLRTPGSAKPRH